MKKTFFKISKMDCPSEEQMIRMKLGDISKALSLEFDIPNRILIIYHEQEDYDEVFEKLNTLNLGTSLLERSDIGNDYVAQNHTTSHEKKLLWQVLCINFFFFGLELGTGYLSQSMGLVADSLDMLADSIIYALAIIATGGSALLKKNIAKSAGYFQMLLAVAGLAEVIRRFLEPDLLPNFKTMMIISALALMGNGICMYILQKSRSKEAHMQASKIFTSNDVIVNLGVIIAGAMVFISHSKYPDLIVSTFVFIIVVKGAIKILQLS